MYFNSSLLLLLSILFFPVPGLLAGKAGLGKQGGGDNSDLQRTDRAQGPDARLSHGPPGDLEKGLPLHCQ